MRTLIIIL